MTPRARTDDDTDPEGPSRSGPRDDPGDESGALSWRARPTWSVLLLISAVLLAAAFVGGASYAVAAVAADKRVAPVERKFDDHIAGMQGKRELMDAYTRQQAEVISEIRADAAETKKMIRALCRASARPAVCLGGE